MKNNKLFIAMSHVPTQEQLTDFGGETVISEQYNALGCSILSPALASNDIASIADNLVKEAISKDCTHFAMNGEPCLVFHSWNAAKQNGLIVVQSTTERISVDNILSDGTVNKTSVFKHMQWRVI